MSCVCVDDGTRDFPTMLGCAMRDNHTTTLRRKTEFLNSTFEHTSRHEISTTIFFENLVDIAIFSYWWMTELDYGTKTFLIELPIFGHLGTWEVEITNDLTEQPHGCIARDIQIKMELTATSAADLDAALSYVGGVDFPTGMSDFINTAGFSASLPKKTTYLGGVTQLVNKHYAKMTVELETDSDAVTFMSWWVKALDYGQASFLIEFPYMGVTRSWQVRLVGDLTENLTGSYTREVNLHMDLLEDIAPLIDAGAGDILCNIC